MKKVFGIILIVVGLVCLPQIITSNAAETIGGLIGVGLVTFLPAYFLLRSCKFPKVSESITTESPFESKQKSYVSTNVEARVETPKKPIDGWYTNLYVELTSKCHPRNFMEPYDHQKVKIANEIYTDVLKSSNDHAKLKELRQRAINELGIQFSTKVLYGQLLDLANPQTYMLDYDSEKVALANDFYQRVKDNADNVIELEKIRDEINNSLLLMGRSLQDSNNSNDDADAYKPMHFIIPLLVILAIMLFFVLISVVTSQREHSNNNMTAEFVDSMAIVEEVGESSSVPLDNNTYQSDFPEYGFSIKSPCPMKDVSGQSNGDFLLNIGGITDEYDSEKMAVYQLVITRLPVGYMDIPHKELEKLVDEILRDKMSRMNSLKRIRFGYEGYQGYEGTTNWNGYAQKGVIFRKDEFIIAMTIITNSHLTEKFNKFTNGFKTLR